MRKNSLVVALTALSLAGMLPVPKQEFANAQPESPWETGAFCTERVSVSTLGVQADGASADPSLSQNGRFVAFKSNASNLVPDDVNGNWDVFLHDRETSETRRLSYSPPHEFLYGFGASLPFVSGDGRTVTYVASAARASPDSPWLCPEPGDQDNGCIVSLDLGAAELHPVDTSPPRTYSVKYGFPALSADGDLLAYWSLNDGLVPGDDNGFSDVFVWSRRTGATELVSVANDGGAADHHSGRSFCRSRSSALFDPVSIAPSGRYVAFTSCAGNLLSLPSNEEKDVFVRDRLAGVTELVSVATDGGPASCESYIHTRYAISDDGRYVSFQSRASGITAPGAGCGQAQAYVRDRSLGRSEMISVSSSGEAANNLSDTSAISGDGRYVVFSSNADNLIPHDTNGSLDIFVRDRIAGRTVRISVSTDGRQSEGPHEFGTQGNNLAISADGLTVAWTSPATNLVEGDTNGVSDVFVRGPCRDGITPEPSVVPSSTSTAPASPSPTAGATESPKASATATRRETPRATASATTTPEAYADCVCGVVQKRVPPVVVTDALANPHRYYGWRVPLDPGKPHSPANPLRECLSLRSNSTPYHPLYNSVVWRVGCQ